MANVAGQFRVRRRHSTEFLWIRLHPAKLVVKLIGTIPPPPFWNNLWRGDGENIPPKKQKYNFLC